MEWHIALRAGYLLPVAAQLGHLDGPMGFGTLHAQSVSAAVGREDWTSIGGVLRRRADIVGLEADAADILVAHAFLTLVQIEDNELLPSACMVFGSFHIIICFRSFHACIGQTERRATKRSANHHHRIMKISATRQTPAGII